MERVKEIKINLKKLLASSLGRVIEELTNLLDSDTTLFDEVIIHQSRYNQVKKDFDLNILTKENRDLVLDKIRSSILACINLIKEVDLIKAPGSSLSSESHILIEKEELRLQIKEILGEVGVDLKSIIEQDRFSIKDEIKDVISSLLSKVEKRETEGFTHEDGNWNITIGEAFYAKKEWDKAAYYFEKASDFFPYNWELHFSKSIAYANSRKNEITDLKALKAYSETIVYMPKDIDSDLKGRIFTYRGAMLKRLNRLDEAEADLVLGEKLVSRQYEKQDVYYNLACVYAMKKNKEKMIAYVKKIDQKFGYKEAIKYHLNNYFKYYSNDEELIHLLW